MEWYEIVIIVIAVILVIAPIISFLIKKKKGTLKCECGHLQSKCTGNCTTCSALKGSNKPINYLTYVLTIEGMKCGMCESHINDVIRKNFDVINVKSSKNTNSTTIVSDHLLNLVKLKELIINQGYKVSTIRIK